MIVILSLTILSGICRMLSLWPMLPVNGSVCVCLTDVIILTPNSIEKVKKKKKSKTCWSIWPENKHTKFYFNRMWNEDVRPCSENVWKE